MEAMTTDGWIFRGAIRRAGPGGFTPRLHRLHPTRGLVMEKGIDPKADYGKQFLNARDGEPPRKDPVQPTEVADEPPGRSVGQMVLIGVIVVVVLGGAAAAVALGGGGGGSVDEDLITAEGVVIDEEGRPVRTTSTTEATTTTTEATTTTTESTTTTSTTTTIASIPGVTTIPGFPPGTPYPTLPPTVPTVPPTQPVVTSPPCPSGSVATNLTGATVTIVGGSWKVEVSGSTTNNTSAAITLLVTVPINYEDEGGAPKTVTAKPAEYGRSIAPGATLNWAVSQAVTSPQQPRPGTPSSSFSWSNSSFASCPTGA